MGKVIKFFRKKENCFDHIISLGYNCEIAYRFFKYFNFEESSLFNWGSTKSIDGLIDILKAPETIYNEGFELSETLWKSKGSEIRLHGKLTPAIMLDKNTDKKIFESDLKDLKEKTKYLIEKFYRILKDDSSKLYIYKVREKGLNENIHDKIVKLKNILEELGGNNFKLLVISAEKYSKYFKTCNEYIYRTVKFYPPDSAVTDEKYEENGFFKIYDEFYVKKPEEKICKKTYKFDKTSRPLSMLKKKYDLIFSIGQACSCSSILRQTRLQFASYPFDWVGGITTVGRAKLICNNFKNFMNKEDLEDQKRNNGAIGRMCRQVYRNKLTNMDFLHDFEINVPFDEMYKQVKEKYERRASRLVNRIENSKNVLVVLIQVPKRNIIEADESLIETQRLLKEKFTNTNIDLLCFNCAEDSDFLITKLSENVAKISYDYDAYDLKFPYNTNNKKLEWIFCNLKISNKFLTSNNILKRLSYVVKKTPLRIKTKMTMLKNLF